MLDLNDLGNGLPGIKKEWGIVLAQVAGVCLELLGHNQGVQLRVVGYANNTYSLRWPLINAQSRRTWADHREATQFGATAIAVLLVKKETGYAVVERSAIGTGIDYWLGNEEDEPLFQHKARLEVSGILNAGERGKNVESSVRSRVREKIQQVHPSISVLPAYVIVVEFSRPIAEVQKI